MNILVSHLRVLSLILMVSIIVGCGSTPYKRFNLFEVDANGSPVDIELVRSAGVGASYYSDLSMTTSGALAAGAVGAVLGTIVDNVVTDGHVTMVAVNHLAQKISKQDLDDQIFGRVESGFTNLRVFEWGNIGWLPSDYYVENGVELASKESLPDKKRVLRLSFAHHFNANFSAITVEAKAEIYLTDMVYRKLKFADATKNKLVGEMLSKDPVYRNRFIYVSSQLDERVKTKAWIANKLEEVDRKYRKPSGRFYTSTRLKEARRAERRKVKFPYNEREIIDMNISDWLNNGRLVNAITSAHEFLVGVMVNDIENNGKGDVWVGLEMLQADEARTTYRLESGFYGGAIVSSPASVREVKSNRTIYPNK